MDKLNCPNCGAPIDVETHKCPYCGTSYFDMSCIDFDEKTPIFLKLKIGDNYLTQKVIPTIGEITFTSEPTYCRSSDGSIMSAFTTNNYMTTNISFESLPWDGRLGYIET